MAGTVEFLSSPAWHGAWHSALRAGLFEQQTLTCRCGATCDCRRLFSPQGTQCPLAVLFCSNYQTGGTEEMGFCRREAGTGIICVPLWVQRQALGTSYCVHACLSV